MLIILFKNIYAADGKEINISKLSCIRIILKSVKKIKNYVDTINMVINNQDTIITLVT